MYLKIYLILLFKPQLINGINLNECEFQWNGFTPTKLQLMIWCIRWNSWVSLLHFPCTLCDTSAFSQFPNLFFFGQILNGFVLVSKPNEICQMGKWEQGNPQCSTHNFIYYNIVDENCYDKENVFYVTNWNTMDSMLRTLHQCSIVALGIGLESTWSNLIEAFTIAWPTATTTTTKK